MRLNTELVIHRVLCYASHDFGDLCSTYNLDFHTGYTHGEQKHKFHAGIKAVFSYFFFFPNGVLNLKISSI